MRRKLHHLLKGEYRPRSICSTGAEEAALLAASAETAAGGGSLLGSAGLEAGLGATAAQAAPFGGLTKFLGDNALSLGLQGAGGLLKASAASDAAARRKTLIDAMGTYQTGNAKKTTALTDKYLEGSTPEARAAANDAAVADNKLGYEKTVGAAQAFEKPGGVAGNISDRYTTDSATAADAQAARTKKLIASLAGMRAPGVTGAANARRYGLAAGEVQGLNDANTSVGKAYRTDYDNVIENPWSTVGGDALSGVGSGIALRDSLKKLRASGEGF